MIEREEPRREVSGPAAPGRRAFLRTMGTGVGLAALGVRPAAAQAKRLTVAYMPHPILLSQMEWMRNGAKQLGLELDTPAIAYVDYVQSMTAQFMSPRNRYQIIWNNDDWGQLFGPFLEPIDDVVKQTWPEDRAWMMRIRGKQTAAPFVLTAGVMFYRTDLVAENEILATARGIVVNSTTPEASFSIDGLTPADAIPKITAWLESRGKGRKTINYKLRDWLFARQRYWGEPFPILWVDGEAKPLPEEQLPLTLPETKNFKPSGSGESPLANLGAWLEATDPASWQALADSIEFKLLKDSEDGQ